MKNILFILSLLLIFSCTHNSDTQNKQELSLNDSVQLNDNEVVEIALQFINSYVENCNRMKESVGVLEWVRTNELTTNHFKLDLNSIVEDAYKLDPEMGLDSDPIFDAQDYPDQGFELDSYDEKTNYILLKGKNQVNFKLTMKMVFENDKCLVDGCGMINIPEDKRIKR